MTILVLGATGNVGSLVVKQLLAQGEDVRVIVRSAGKLAGLPQGKLTIVKASLLELSAEQLKEHIAGCSAVVSCLGHNMTFKGIFGHPRQLVLQALELTCQAIQRLQSAKPVKLIHLNTIGVSNPDGSDPPRGIVEDALVYVLSTILPPFRDSYDCVQYLYHTIGLSHPAIEWCAVRPDSFVDGEVSQYSVHQQLRTRVLAPGQSTKANIAHFLSKLALQPAVWEVWRFKMPTILDDKPAAADAAPAAAAADKPATGK